MGYICSLLFHFPNDFYILTTRNSVTVPAVTLITWCQRWDLNEHPSECQQEPTRSRSPHMMASNYMLPPTPPLEIHDPQEAEKWKRFKHAWMSYSLATGLRKSADAVQVAMLLTVIGECFPHSLGGTTLAIAPREIQS